VARRQIAKVLVRSLRSNEALRKTFELIAETGPEQNDFGALFGSVDPDEERALDGVHDAKNMPLNGEPQKVIADLKDVRRAFGG
jgi:hypothetical protein